MARLLTFAIALFGFTPINYANEIPTDSTNKGMIFDMPEQMPKFPGGGDAMEQFINDNIKYPAEAKSKNIQGKVYVQFIVEKDGSISEVSIRRGAHKSLDDEAIRVVKLMPNWEPGAMRGKKVRVRYTLPITFSLTQPR